jgi:chaperone modulatory protein CbpM
MMDINELVTAISPLRRSDVEIWVREQLIAPKEEGGRLIFSDKECARVRLICSLHYELDIDVDTLPVVLSLVDQLYDARQRLLSLSAAVSTQNKEIQDAIIATLEKNAVSPEADKT